MKQQDSSTKLFLMLAALRGTNSSDKKIKILKDFRSEDVEKVLRLVYTPHQTWGVTSKVLDSRARCATSQPAIYWWPEMYATFASLASRELSGAGAKLSVQTLWQFAPTPDHADLFRLILDRDLRIGLDTKTLNKAYPDFIEVFACQLAKEYNPKFITYPVYVEPKIDGIRALAIEGKLYSRTGTQIHNIAIEQHLPQHLVLDGELFAGDWAKTITARSDQGTPMEYHVFDVIPLIEWKTGKFTTSLSERLELPFSSVGPIQRVLALQAHSAEFLESVYAKHLDDGYEGVMIKDPQAPYSLKRSRAWMKLKPTQTLIAEVIGLQEGTGKNEGALGALVCKTGAGRHFNVGTGFSEEQRNALWQAQTIAGLQMDTLPSNRVVVKYQSLTVAGAPLFPRFISWCKS